MARQRAPVQVNQFIGGLNTEANPVGYPANATVDEQNVSLLKDGSRRRRKGFDVEEDYNTIDTGVLYDDSRTIGRGQFRWKNPGNLTSRELMVVQVGNFLSVHDMDESVLSTTPLFTETFNYSTYGTDYGFAVVDGILTVATGEEVITLLEFDGTSVTSSSESLLIRDFFGVEAIINGVDLTDPLNQSVRPTSLTDEHLYNLRNQTFALPRARALYNDELVDTVANFYNHGDPYWPSNTDSTVPHISANPNEDSNRTVERFHGEDLVKTPTGWGEAPKGFFLIDPLRRGESRLEQEAKLRSENSVLSKSVSSLPLDYTDGGPSVLAQFAGRVWYSGFSGTVIDGDSLSPKLTSYVMFSQVVNNSSQVTRCYQEASPTSNVDAEIVATDGGYIKLDGAYNIKAMLSVQSSLFVFAENGIWQISGTDSGGFNATGYVVSKLGSEGCTSSRSVVNFEQVIMFWGDSSLYAVTQNEIGEYSLTNVSKDTIQTIYDDISSENKKRSTGYYDFSSDSFRWLYGSDLSGEDISEIVYNTRFGVFTKNLISTGGSTLGPISVTGGQKFTRSGISNVTSDGAIVTDSSLDDVYTNLVDYERDSRDSYYVVILSKDTTLTYTFGGFVNESPYDWISLGSGVDSPAYLTSGPITGGDARLRKEVPYVTTYFSRTEDEDLGDVDSSCYLSSKWDWTTDVNTGRWSTPRQIYRPSRTSSGHDMVVTRNRIRGSGRAVGLHFEAEEGKTFRLYGWDHNLDSSSEE